MLIHILHANYDTQSRYKATVELLAQKQKDYFLNFVLPLQSCSCPRPRITLPNIVVFSQNGSKSGGHIPLSYRYFLDMVLPLWGLSRDLR